ncbi:MAG: hypothetical protein ACYTG1_07540 [Planctomycetota bacterium]|jgi:hypothetical protein
MSATSAKAELIDDLMEKASRSLAATSYFEAERLALKGLDMARQVADYERMARIVLPLQEARRQRLQLALDTGEVSILGEPVTEESVIEPGCHLVQPPLVGADARRYRLAALAAEVPVAVLCREPHSQIGLIPVVAISPGTTVRTKVRPPRDAEAPDLAWFVDSMEAIGDWAIESIDPETEIFKQVDAILDRLDAIPDHEKLHQALAEACRDAHREQVRRQQEEAAAPRSKKRVRQ